MSILSTLASKKPSPSSTSNSTASPTIVLVTLKSWRTALVPGLKVTVILFILIVTLLAHFRFIESIHRSMYVELESSLPVQYGKNTTTNTTNNIKDNISTTKPTTKPRKCVSWDEPLARVQLRLTDQYHRHEDSHKAWYLVEIVVLANDTLPPLPEPLENNLGYFNLTRRGGRSPSTWSPPPPPGSYGAFVYSGTVTNLTTNTEYEMYADGYIDPSQNKVTLFGFIQHRRKDSFSLTFLSPSSRLQGNDCSKEGTTKNSNSSDLCGNIRNNHINVHELHDKMRSFYDYRFKTQEPEANFWAPMIPEDYIRTRHQCETLFKNFRYDDYQGTKCTHVGLELRALRDVQHGGGAPAGWPSWYQVEIVVVPTTTGNGSNEEQNFPASMLRFLPRYFNLTRLRPYGYYEPIDEPLKPNTLNNNWNWNLYNFSFSQAEEMRTGSQMYNRRYKFMDRQTIISTTLNLNHTVTAYLNGFLSPNRSGVLLSGFIDVERNYYAQSVDEGEGEGEEESFRFYLTPYGFRGSMSLSQRNSCSQNRNMDKNSQIWVCDDRNSGPNLHWLSLKPRASVKAEVHFRLASNDFYTKSTNQTKENPFKCPFEFNACQSRTTYEENERIKKQKQKLKKNLINLKQIK